MTADAEEKVASVPVSPSVGSPNLNDRARGRNKRLEEFRN